MKKYQSLIIYILLIFLLNYITSSIYFPSIQEKHEKILYEACQKNNTIFCSMTDSIRYIFDKVQLLKSDFSGQSMDSYYNFSLIYSSVSTPNIICEEVEPISIERGGNEKYLITFSNCVVLVYGHLSIANNGEGTINYNNQFSELYFNKITFYQNKSSTSGQFNVEYKHEDTDEEMFNYNKNDPKFSIEIFDIKSQMNQILRNIFEFYKTSIESITQIKDNDLNNQKKYFTDTINKFTKGYSIINNPYIGDDDNILTYVGFKINYVSYINVKDKIFLPILTVTFEYALNYNITYNEGNFTVGNISFDQNSNEEDHFGDMIEKNAEFNDFPIEPFHKQQIWDDIFKDFKEKFYRYKSSSGQENANSK